MEENEDGRKIGGKKMKNSRQHSADWRPKGGPGLGVEIDESQFEKVNADPQRQFKWPRPKQSDGSVTDY
jgi:hypothetical protein